MHFIFTFVPHRSCPVTLHAAAHTIYDTIMAGRSKDFISTPVYVLIRDSMGSKHWPEGGSEKLEQITKKAVR